MKLHVLYSETETIEKELNIIQNIVSHFYGLRINKYSKIMIIDSMVSELNSYADRHSWHKHYVCPIDLHDSKATESFVISVYKHGSPIYALTINFNYTEVEVNRMKMPNLDSTIEYKHIKEDKVAL